MLANKNKIKFRRQLIQPLFFFLYLFNKCDLSTAFWSGLNKYKDEIVTETSLDILINYNYNYNY